MEQLTKSGNLTDQVYGASQQEKIINKHFALSGNPITLSTINKLARSDPSHNYFWELYECACFAGRMQPFRKTVEDLVIDHLEEQVASKKRDRLEAVTITEFASGKLFPLFVLINRLVAKGYRNFIINGLDLEYKSLIDYTKTLRRNGAIFDISMPFNADQKILIPYLKDLTKMDSEQKSSPNSGKMEIDEETEDNQSNDEVLTTLFEAHQYYQIVKQFTGWFDATKKFDSSNRVSVSLTLYADAFKYQELCKKNTQKKSDIIVALDYYPDETLPIFESTVKHGLKKDGFAATVINIDTRPISLKSEESSKDDHYLITQKDDTVTINRFMGTNKMINQVLTYSSETGKLEKNAVYRLTNVSLKSVDTLPSHRKSTRQSVEGYNNSVMVMKMTDPRSAKSFFL